MKSPLSRRRFLTISASTLAASIIPGSGLMANPSPVRWQGTALGARAELILNHPIREEAEAALRLVHDEIRRLEKIFSLYDENSDLSQLNSAGALSAPPLDLIRCLDDAQQISQITDGAFDVTVQPLWEMYARHFANSSPDTAGPKAVEIATARALVDFNGVQIGSQKISVSRPGMKITLNGIAQGYITDRVAEVLKAQGFENVLIDLGETRGLGHRNDGSDWQVGIKAPDGSGNLMRKLALRNKAIATSGGYGTTFTADGAYHHLFDPKTGRSADHWDTVSVISDDATRADALSTAFSSMSEIDIRRIADKMSISVIASNDTSDLLINL